MVALFIIQCLINIQITVENISNLIDKIGFLKKEGLCF